MVEPYLYPIDGVQVLMTSAVVPIVMSGKFVGVAGVDLPLKDIQQKAHSIKPLKPQKLTSLPPMETMFPTLMTAKLQKRLSTLSNLKNSKMPLKMVQNYKLQVSTQKTVVNIYT